MKKVSLTVRVPIFVDVELDMDDTDYETLIDEWDKTNFGIVKNIVGEYVDLESVDLINTQERYGDPEVVDVRIYENSPEINKSTGADPDGIECNMIAPKGKLN